MKLKCLIIDDEPIARKGLEEHIQEIEFLDCIASCENALQASTFLNERKIDLLYLDIHMPKVTGIDFLKSLKNPPLPERVRGFSGASEKLGYWFAKLSLRQIAATLAVEF